MGILKKINLAAQNRATYTAGLLQARAYKILKERTSVVLAPLGISTTEWAFLGLLMERSSGMRPKEAAKEIGVEASFVTVMVAHLKKNNWVKEIADGKDSRAKLISITVTGKEFVKNTEIHVRNEMRSLIKGSTPSELLNYVSVLENIIKNSK